MIGRHLRLFLVTHHKCRRLRHISWYFQASFMNEMKVGDIPNCLIFGDQSFSLWLTLLELSPILITFVSSSSIIIPSLWCLELVLDLFYVVKSLSPWGKLVSSCCIYFSSLKCNGKSEVYVLISFDGAPNTCFMVSFFVIEVLLAAALHEVETWSVVMCWTLLHVLKSWMVWYWCWKWADEPSPFLFICFASFNLKRARIQIKNNINKVLLTALNLAFKSLLRSRNDWFYWGNDVLSSDSYPILLISCLICYISGLRHGWFYLISGLRSVLTH